MDQREHNACVIRLLEEGYSLKKLKKAIAQAQIDWVEICDERDANYEMGRGPMPKDYDKRRGNRPSL